MTSMSDKPLKDSGKRTTFKSGAQKELVVEKGRYDLLPGAAMSIIPFSKMDPDGVHVLAKTYGKGVKKYSPRNWEKGLPLWSFMDSALRHLYKAKAGKKDEDHLGQALWNIVGYIDTEIFIDRGKFGEELRDPKPRTFKPALITAEYGNDIDGIICSIHKASYTGDTSYMANAAIRLCSIIGVRERKK